MKVLRSSSNRNHVSPLRYPGGKTCLVPLFEKVIKDNSLSDITYVEPYAGGAGAALALLYSGKVGRIVINDLDPAVHAFWKSATESSDAFIAKMHSTPVNIKEWKRQRKIYQDKNAKTFDRGFATFYLNRTNVSGIMGGGPIGGLNQEGKYKINARFNKKTLAKRLEQLATYTDRISVTNKDGVGLIKNYLGRKDTFIYLDPPYFEKGSSLYMNSYKGSDHGKLADVLNDNPDSFWLLTYDNKRQIKSLYPNRRIVNFTLDYRAYQARVGKEVLILSDLVVV
jgi:DNA adenine methylase